MESLAFKITRNRILALDWKILSARIVFPRMWAQGTKTGGALSTQRKIPIKSSGQFSSTNQKKINS
jgi:hypothetical protein